MPRKIKSGVGMMQRETLQYDLKAGDSERRALAEALHTFFRQPVGDELREKNAKWCREILKDAGVCDAVKGGVVHSAPLRQRGFAENSAQWLAAHWLAAFARLEYELERLEAGKGDVQAMIGHAQELGRIWERIYWRCGVDPETGKRREQLALGKRQQEKAISRATEARRIQAQDTAPDWHDEAVQAAREIRRRHPTYSRWRIAGEIHEDFGVSRSRCDKVLRANGIR